MRVGVLALQGDFAAHRHALAATGLESKEIRSAEDLSSTDGLVLPGGESTTMLKLLEGNRLHATLLDHLARGVPTLATCAGVILLAREITDPAQGSLGVLDISVARNAYGRQLESSIEEAVVEATDEITTATFEAVFIRAPRITRVGPKVRILARYGSDPILIRQNRILAATFHPELSVASPVIELFAREVRRGGGQIAELQATTTGV
jgi:5'-phosphate synthase pdxT subunit